MKYYVITINVFNVYVTYVTFFSWFQTDSNAKQLPRTEVSVTVLLGGNLHDLRETEKHLRIPEISLSIFPILSNLCVALSLHDDETHCRQNAQYPWRKGKNIAILCSQRAVRPFLHVLLLQCSHQLTRNIQWIKSMARLGTRKIKQPQSGR